MENIKSISIQYLEHIEEADKSRQLTAGKFLFPGFTYEFVVQNRTLPGGKFRYVTGLEEEDVQEERKEEVRQAKAELENFYGKGVLNPANEEFWKDIKLTLNKKNTFLDLNKNIQDKLFYYIIKGGGIPEIAPTYRDAVDKAQQMRWFLVEPDQLADLSVEEDKYYDRAIAGLVDLETNKTFDDMMLVHKVLVTSDRGITRQTPKSAIYKDLSDFIKGKIVKTDKKRTPAQFVETMELLKKDRKKLYITAYVKDAIYFNFIHTNNDNQLVNMETKTKYGGSADAVVKKLYNPAFQEELENIKLKVEKKWSE